MSNIEPRDECPNCGSERIGRIEGTDMSGACGNCSWTGSLYVVEDNDGE